MRFAPAIGGEQLLFDFDKFSSITASVYADSPYSLAEVLEVFRYYFEQYEAYTGAPHPPIRAVQIERVIREMPYIDETDKANSTMDIDPDCYEDMIDKHFRTRYRNCDYNINHFFSGRIRELRFYETCY